MPVHLMLFASSEQEQVALEFQQNIFLRASPGAASPLSSMAMRLSEYMGAFLALALIIRGTL